MWTVALSVLRAVNIVHTLLFLSSSLPLASTTLPTSTHRLCSAGLAFVVCDIRDSRGRGSGLFSPMALRLSQRALQRASPLPSFPYFTSSYSSLLARRAGVVSRCSTAWPGFERSARHVPQKFSGRRCREVFKLPSTHTRATYRDDEQTNTVDAFGNDDEHPNAASGKENMRPIDCAAPQDSEGGRVSRYTGGRDAFNDDVMVYTWDGDLMPSLSLQKAAKEAYSEENETSLADGEFAVYNQDGDEALQWWPWELSSGTDSWDTYDTDFVPDCLSIQFAQSSGFSVPADYNWNATTSENYRAEATAGNFHGIYKDVRERMDYKYHVNYVTQRQVLQDQIVTYWRNEGRRSSRPWLIFTAGAMGSGKSHMLNMLQQSGCKSLGAMVKVDPDTVKYQLPEMQHYIQRNPGPNPQKDIILAGHATHNESAFLQELIVREMLEDSKSMIIDGSLSNAEWYKDYILKIRSKYPHYRIGILHVVCDRNIIWERVQARCEKTGRCIARHIVDLSVKKVPKAVEMLTPLADFVTVLRSDGDLTDDKLNDGFKTIVFKYVREELVESQVRIGSMQSDDNSFSVRRSIQVLESLLADRD